MAESLQKKTLSGVIWSFTENFMLQIIQFVIGVLMARILTPGDYGLVGMLSIFMAVSQALVNSGFSNALTRKVDRTELDCSTVFYFNIVVGFVLYLAIFFAAPLIAQFYKAPLLEDLTKVIALPLIFNSLCIVQQARLTIKMDFRTQAKISVTSSIVTGLSGLAMAYSGFGVWTLAYSSVIGAVVRCILMWWLAHWKPLWAYSWQSFRELFSYGSKLLASGLIDTIYGNIYPLIIGRLFSAKELGYYSRGYGYAALPSTIVYSMLSRVTFPLLCEIQNDDERLERVYRQLLRLFAFLIFPLMMGFAAVAHPVIVAMITEKWEPCVPYLQIMCFSFMFYPIHAMNLSLLQVKGRSDLFLKLEIIKKIVGVSVILITFPFGVLYMCVGSVCSSILCLVINTYYTGKLIHVGFLMQMRDLLPTILYSLSMGVLVYGVTLFFDSNLLKIAVGMLVGLLYYPSVAYFTKSSEFSYLISMIKNRKKQ